MTGVRILQAYFPNIPISDLAWSVAYIAVLLGLSIYGLLALAIGMSVNNARGVVEAVLRKHSEFTRTPKRGSRNEGAPRAAHYVPARTWIPLVEGAFAAFFLFCLADALADARWTSVPFLLLFVAGFVYAAALSLHARFRGDSAIRQWGGGS